MPDFEIRLSLPSWREWLDEFERDALPEFAGRGYSRDAALLAWHLNETLNLLRRAAADPDGDAPWKRPPA